MNARMKAIPYFRYLSRSTRSPSRKYSWRRPISAKTFVVRTMNQLSVMPKIAGIESSANSTSVLPIATSTITIGVHIRRPPTVVRSRLPS